jgi:hypothetical protein
VTAAYGPIDPNSEHQMWSRWVFGVESPVKQPDVEECITNAQRYFAKGFGTVGRVRCDQQGTYYCLVVEVEGPPAHDPGYVESVRRQFVKRFMAQGFGPSAYLTRFTAGVLAGNCEDGQPPTQMLVMPSVVGKPTMWGD